MEGSKRVKLSLRVNRDKKNADSYRNVIGKDDEQKEIVGRNVHNEEKSSFLSRDFDSFSEKNVKIPNLPSYTFDQRRDWTPLPDLCDTVLQEKKFCKPNPVAVLSKDFTDLSQAQTTWIPLPKPCIHCIHGLPQMPKKAESGSTPEINDEERQLEQTLVNCANKSDCFRKPDDGSSSHILQKSDVGVVNFDSKAIPFSKKVSSITSESKVPTVNESSEDAENVQLTGKQLYLKEPNDVANSGHSYFTSHVDRQMTSSEKKSHQSKVTNNTTIHSRDPDGNRTQRAAGLTMTLQQCPLCGIAFDVGLSQLSRDEHIAACLSDTGDDVIW